MKKTILIALIYCLLSFTLAGQRYISGRVTDAEDGFPIPSVTVFIANTTVGTTTDAEGYYKLRIPSEGFFQLSVSHVGYQSFIKDIESDNKPVTLNIAMNIRELDEVVVSKKVPFRQKDIRLFWKTILGQNPSRRGIYVLNPEKVYYFYNSETQVLRVTCNEPLQIINNETGYYIHYVLNHFTHEYGKEITDWGHQCNYTELKSDTKRQMNNREIKRREVYNISLEKFIKALYNYSLLNEGFVLTSFHENSDPADPYQISLVNQDSLLSINLADNSKTFNLSKVQLMVICYGRPVTVDDLKKIQETNGKEFLINSGLFMNLLKGDSIRIFPDGTYADKLTMSQVNSSGTLLGLNMRLPIDYIP